MAQMVFLWRAGLGPWPTGGNPGIKAPMQSYVQSQMRDGLMSPHSSFQLLVFVFYTSGSCICKGLEKQRGACETAHEFTANYLSCFTEYNTLNSEHVVDPSTGVSGLLCTIFLN